MITLTTKQDAIIAANSKSCVWLFTIKTAAGVYYRWSNQYVARLNNWRGCYLDPNSGDFSYYRHGEDEEFGWNYTYKITKFDGIEVRRGYAENTIIAPSDLVFEVGNADSGLTLSDFVGGHVLLSLGMTSDNTNWRVIRRWRFDINRIETEYKILKFTCVDFMQKYLKGDYPNTPIVSGLFLNSNKPKGNEPRKTDNYCVPKIFGQVYIPLRPVYITADAKVYYLLGDMVGSPTYTITKVRSPRDFNRVSTWTTSGTQYTKAGADSNNYRVAEFIIADSNSDGTADVNGVWADGDRLLDILCDYNRSDTSSITSPTDILREVLKDMGIESNKLDTESWATAKASYAADSITFKGGWWYRQPREQVLTNLLLQMHACLIVDENIKIQVLSKTSQKTFTTAYILKDTFNYSLATTTTKDAGYCAFSGTSDPFDALNKYIVPAKTSATDIDDDTLEFNMVHDTQIAQKMTHLYLQRKLLIKGTVDFSTNSKMLALNPFDGITINDALYGGSYMVYVDSIKINKDLRLDLSCTQYSESLDDYSDLSYSDITVATDSTTTYWKPMTAGYDSPDVSDGPNKMLDRLWVKDKILLDGANSKIDLYNAAVTPVRVLKLGLDGSHYGLYIYDTAGTTIYGKFNEAVIVIGATTGTNPNMIFDSTNGLRLRQGTTDYVKIDMSGNASFAGSISVGSELVMSTTGKIYSAGKTSYADTDAGFFIGYDTDGYKINIGASASYFKWSGTALDIKITNGENITVDGGGGIQINAGGNMYLRSSASNASAIVFENKDGTDICLMKNVVGSDLHLVLNPATDDAATFFIGDATTSYRWKYIYSSCSTLCSFQVGGAASLYGYVGIGASYVYINSVGATYSPQIKVDSSDGQIEFTGITGLIVESGDYIGLSSTTARCEFGASLTLDAGTSIIFKKSNTAIMNMDAGGLYPETQAGADLGTDTLYWDDVYADDFITKTYLCDIGLDSYINAINNIKNHKTKIDKHHHKPMFDKETLPEFCLRRSETGEHGVSISGLISVLIGAIKELNNKIEEIKK